MEAVFRKPRLLRAWTSLEAGEFTRLLTAFEQESQARRGRLNRCGQARQRAPGATGNAGVLPTARARLFFVLFYFKCYPLQEVMGLLVRLSGRQTKRTKPVTEPALLAGLWSLLGMLNVLEDHPLEELRATADFVLGKLVWLLQMATSGRHSMERTLPASQWRPEVAIHPGTPTTS